MLSLYKLIFLKAKLAISLGGTCTGEHGIGAGKRELLELEAGAGAMRLMNLIKRAVDPDYILNPGKVLKEKEKCIRDEL